MARQNYSETFSPQNLASAVHQWLEFQALCHRSVWFSEAFLAQPVAEYLSATAKGTVIAEFDHPVFKKAQPGAPKRIDYVIQRGQKLEYAIEAKWAGFIVAKLEPQRYVDDLLRLALLPGAANVGERFFLLAGDASLPEMLKAPALAGFDKLPKRPLSLLLPTTDDESVQVQVRDQEDPAFKRLFDKFKETYKIETLPTSMRIKRVGFAAGRLICVMVWKIYKKELTVKASTAALS